MFPYPYRAWEDLEVDVRAWMEAHPGAFDSPGDAVTLFFSNVIMPPSRRWALKSNDKTGSTSVMRVLYELEWGTPFTVEMIAPDDINTESVIHRQMHAEVLRRAHHVQGGIAALPEALRLTTVRHPSVRAVSAFLYLCKSQEKKATWMVEDRIRMGAMVGFDWTKHMDRPDGFLRFLDYVLGWTEMRGIGAVNTHWRPQWDLVRPDLFQPDLIGRCEALAPFFADLAARFDKPVPAIPRSNAQSRYDPSPFLACPGVRDRLAKLYGADYETFGYELDEVP